MKAIKELAGHIESELKDADEYADLALHYMDDDHTLGDMYRTLANEEIGHAHKEHEQTVRLINEYKRDGKEPPAAMIAVWEWEHDRMVEHEAAVKMKLSMFK